MISCFSAYGTGAALAISVTIDDRSAVASSSVGQRHDPLQLRRRGERVGDAVLLHELDPARRVELAQHDDRCAERVRQRRERERSGVVQRAGREVHRVLVQQVAARRAARTRACGRSACAARPSACRSCPTCRSSPRPPRDASAATSGSVSGWPAQQLVPARCSPSGTAPPKTTTVRTFGMLGADLRRRAAPARRRRRPSSRRSCR